MTRVTGVVVLCVVVGSFIRISGAQTATTCVARDRRLIMGPFVDADTGQPLLDFSIPGDHLAFALDADGNVTRSQSNAHVDWPGNRLVYEPKRTLICEGDADTTCRPVGARLRRYLESMRARPCDHESASSVCPFSTEAWMSSDHTLVLLGEVTNWYAAWSLKRDREITVRQRHKRPLVWTFAGAALLAVEQAMTSSQTGGDVFVVAGSGKLLATLSGGTPVVLSATRVLIVSSDATLLDLKTGRTLATLALETSETMRAALIDEHHVAAAWQTSSGWTLASIEVAADDKVSIAARGSIPFCP